MGRFETGSFVLNILCDYAERDNNRHYSVDCRHHINGQEILPVLKGKDHGFF
jgi:hypothetical protein